MGTFPICCRYFSTLDGFGQRSKHQLLLDPTLRSSGEPNRLPAVLGRGLHALLLDLFLHGGGPALRARYAHCEACGGFTWRGDDGEGGGSERGEGEEGGGEGGEAAPPPPHAPPLPLALRLAYSALLALCAQSHTQPSLARADGTCQIRQVGRMHAELGRALKWLETYRSLCRPAAALRRARVRLSAALRRSLRYGGRYLVQPAGGGGSGLCIQTPALRCAETSSVTACERGAEGEAESEAEGEGEPPSLLVGWEEREVDRAARARLEMLDRSVRCLLCSAGCGGKEGVLEAEEEEDAAAAAEEEQHQEQHQEEEEEEEGEGAVIECSRWGVLSCCEQFLRLEASRLAAQRARVASRAASTSQRRQFVRRRPGNIVSRRGV